jgi:hypothetical protein
MPLKGLAFLYLVLALAGCTLTGAPATPATTIARTAAPRVSSPAAPSNRGNSSGTSEQEVGAPTQNGISREEALLVSPLCPSNVSVTIQDGKAFVRWRGTGEDVSSYEMLRKNSASDLWIQLANVAEIGDNRGWYEWKDTVLKSGDSYIYGIRAINVFGTQSTISESPVVTAP